MSSSTIIDPQSALQSLRHIVEPSQNKDIVTLGMVQELKISPAGQVSLRLVLSTPAHPLKEKFQEEIKRSLKAKGAVDVFIMVDSKVQAANRPTSHQGGKRVEGVSAIR